ncbi:Sec-independent protein translocase protein TatB [Bradyrhizobium sp. LHD-71]|uniref:Sec-independent protein translocase protein TatB n=1 Tax=Bradyrhizobium sp. LHD-71 TaxID=3072141 RepID=UPI00280D5606|nr:Sec-independent protein translocase protein TatB [Bradyrhizobium sp. LHD-71]MDQ8728818.1 Sec-independent protein translocase protein TatB [Bradyrhizobium sp. LHD-71]
MFDIGWSELIVIGVVALIAIGPKELPGVLRMVGQWIGKARRMAGEFQSQFQEAMREAEVADLKKQFDDVSQAASNAASGNVLTSTVKDVEEALKLDTSSVATPTTPEPPTAETQKEATVHEAESPPPQPETLQPVDKAS